MHANGFHAYIYRQEVLAPRQHLYMQCLMLLNVSIAACAYATLLLSQHHTTVEHDLLIAAIALAGLHN
jgi:hypothetical protein